MRKACRMVGVLVALLLLAGGASAGKSASEWAQRRIYQVMTDRFARPSSDSSWCNVNEYCGGTFAAMADHLDYIQGMGFNAIWISPIVANTPGGYHGYWARDFFAVNPHFGTAEELTAFVNKAHSMDIWIMVDIVVNHVGPVGRDYVNIYPFNQTEHYHKECQVNNYQCFTEEVYNCRLADLPDLNQTVPFVREQLSKAVVWLLETFKFDGIRADTVMYIDETYWKELQQTVNTYLVGEVWSSFSCNLAYARHSIDATLNYPMYNTLRNVYQGKQSMWYIGEQWREQQAMPQPTWEVNFIDNQDNDRYLTPSGTTVSSYMSVIAHMFFAEGIPCIYYGTEQYYRGVVSTNENRGPLWTSGYNTSTPMYQFLARLSAAHAQFQPWAHEFQERWRDESVYCYVRGALFVCTTNREGEEHSRTIPNLPFAGKTMCNWLDPQADCVEGSDTMIVTLPSSGMPMVFYAS